MEHVFDVGRNGEGMPPESVYNTAERVVAVGALKEFIVDTYFKTKISISKT